MCPKKLTEDNKQEILNLYRQTEATAPVLAGRFGVSHSTISRLLKSQLPGSEYEELIEYKRTSRTLPHNPQETSEKVAAPTSEGEPQYPPSPTKKPSPVKIIAAAAIESVALADEEPFGEEDEGMDEGNVTALEEMLGEDLADLDEDEAELEEDEEEDWEDEKEGYYSSSLSIQDKLPVQVLPLSAASFPRTCYVVIDRAAELVVRPLKEFADLGRIPPEEVQQRTLPVFDNQKVAQRFSRRFASRSQRIIKVPDGRLFEKTGSYLQAKGITRLLIDGQVYSL